MAKTFKTQTTVYKVTANVVRKTDSGFTIDTYCDVLNSKNERLIKREIVSLQSA